MFFNTNDSRSCGVGAKEAFLAWSLNSDNRVSKCLSLDGTPKACSRMGLAIVSNINNDNNGAHMNGTKLSMTIKNPITWSPTKMRVKRLIKFGGHP